MIIARSVVENITITDAEGHDPIQALVEDVGPGVGRMTLTEGGTSHHAYWNNMGDRTVAEFFTKAATVEYLTGCFDNFGTWFRKIEPSALREQLAAELVRQEGAGEITPGEHIKLLEQLHTVTPVSDISGLHALCNPLMSEIYGPAWSIRANELFLGKHPKYLALISRINVVRQVLSK